jgi:hypothetical protein
MKDAETIRMEIEQQIALREGELEGLRAAADALSKEQPRSRRGRPPRVKTGQGGMAPAKV